MKRIYIIESLPGLQNDMCQALERDYQVQFCQRAEQALQDIKTFMPDLLVMDMTMPALDGMGLLSVLFTAGIRPKLIVSMNYMEDAVYDILSRYRVSFLLCRPVHNQVLLHRILDVLLELSGGETTDRTRIANNLLLKLGFSLGLQGYRCILEAIDYICMHPDCMIANELYPELGKRLGGNAKQIEHCIRTCIQKAWNNRDERIWELYFPRNRYGNLVRLSNGAFLKRIAYAVDDFYSFSCGEQPEQKQA